MEQVKKPMMYNLSNHEYKTWSLEQREAAKEIAEKVWDIRFPNVPADADEDEVAFMAEDICKQLSDLVDQMGDGYILIQGEMCLTHAIVSEMHCRFKGVLKPIAACSERYVRYDSDGNKIVKFEFMQFREYPDYQNCYGR